MACDCPLSGRCETHGLNLTDEQHRQCRDVPGMFEAFAAVGERRTRKAGRPAKSRAARKPKPSTDASRAASHADCIYRGEQTGETRCGCGGGKKTMPVFACAMHGQCGERQATTAGVKWCRWCDDYSTAQITLQSGP